MLRESTNADEKKLLLNKIKDIDVKIKHDTDHKTNVEYGSYYLHEFIKIR